MTVPVTADTSVVIPALTSWHESHEVASAAVADVDRLPAHVIMESLSVLTRLPHGLAIDMSTAVETLREAFPGLPLVLGVEHNRELLDYLTRGGITGGQVYDALIAMTARVADATLLTLDQRATPTYALIGASVLEVVGPASRGRDWTDSPAGRAR